MRGGTAPEPQPTPINRGPGQAANAATMVSQSKSRMAKRKRMGRITFVAECFPSKK